ncbi:hypothetical protein GCM10029976_006980 [Kribbella albertanoniae]
MSRLEGADRSLRAGTEIAVNGDCLSGVHKELLDGLHVRTAAALALRRPRGLREGVGGEAGRGQAQEDQPEG